ncbi:hypothetical protein PanWU01x14_159220 [Parasponia andersonii]|uniref:Uncharacterized protein n=1 Tax=Parasponia andersonii TaxID=3476 RepID=A0A2P5CEC0_PARAD|nr:hypothetical protein PanWU01x14_159220 [Parasponia andersonii]
MSGFYFYLLQTLIEKFSSIKNLYPSSSPTADLGDLFLNSFIDSVKCAKSEMGLGDPFSPDLLPHPSWWVSEVFPLGSSRLASELESSSHGQAKTHIELVIELDHLDLRWVRRLWRRARERR